MQKAAATFDATKGRILPDLSKGKKMTEATENGNGVKINPNTGKPIRQKGQTVQVLFVADNGEAAKSPAGRNIQKLKVVFPKNKTQHEFEITKLSPDILMQVAAFGLATLLRNEANTTPEEEGPEEAEANLLSRWNGFANGTYRSISTGSATPLIILALQRALTNAGKTPEEIAATVAKYQGMWDEGDDDEAIKKNRREITKGLMDKNPIKLAKLQIEAERAEARKAKMESAGSEDLSDL